MNHIVIQLLLSALFGAASLRLLTAIRKHRIGRRRAVGWLALWAMGFVVVWFPNLTMQLARTLGVTRGVDAILYLSVAWLTYIVFRLYSALEKQDQVMTRLVSQLALQSPPDLKESQPERRAHATSGEDNAAPDCGEPQTDRRVRRAA